MTNTSDSLNILQALQSANLRTLTILYSNNVLQLWNNCLILQRIVLNLYNTRFSWSWCVRRQKVPVASQGIVTMSRRVALNFCRCHRLEQMYKAKQRIGFSLHHFDENTRLRTLQTCKWVDPSFGVDKKHSGDRPTMHRIRRPGPYQRSYKRPEAQKRHPTHILRQQELWWCYITPMSKDSGQNEEANAQS